MDEVGQRRLLVVSDMHLGRDCKDITGFNRTARPDDKFDQAFIDMLDHYTSAREREWRLIFAGDMIDFVEVVVVPGAKGPLNLKLSFEISEEEREFGLGSEAERALVKLDKTLEYHSKLFVRLAHFIREGGEVVIIRGNHDTELYWRKVQKVLRRRLADLAFRGQKYDIDETIDKRTDFQSRLGFSPWMYVEPGRIWIEHGHQYDPYCSYDKQLYPVSPQNPRKIDTPLFAFAMRYFVNMLSDFAPHNADMWGPRDYFEWLRNKGMSGLLYTAKMGLGAGIRMLLYAGHFALGRVRRYGKEHNKNLRLEAKKYGVPKEKLQEIDQLRHVPVNRNLPELMRLLFLDRILLVAGCLTLAMLMLLVFESPWFELAGIVTVALIGLQINRKLAPRRYFLPGPKQQEAAKKIAKVMDVPLVVMGHSHVRRSSEIGPGKLYVNTGCWLPPLDGAPEHTDVNQPCTCKLSHLVVEDKPELRVFCRAAQTVRLADVAETKPHRDDEEGHDVMHNNTADILTS
ncbi:MAG: metallophosphoesterase [Deltaproteobacteria bacterium]